MICLVTANQELFDSSEYRSISVNESIEIMNTWNKIQYDSETTGRDAHVNKLLCAQFGNKEADIQIVVDCNTVDIRRYKKTLESRLVIGHNLKFDLQFLYNYGIIPLQVYDTMIVEQMLYMGYPSGQVSFSLKETAWRRLQINIDKTVRGEIIWRGLDSKVIKYAAGDVLYLEDIMWSQVADCKAKECLVGAKVECDFVPSIAYMEWCGIKLDVAKWKEKMKADKEKLDAAIKELNNFVVKTPTLSKYVFIDRQGDLFTGFNLEPQVNINWSSSKQVIDVAKILGFDTAVKDKKTGEDKDSVIEKHLSTQKGINDEFLKLYFDYQKHAKVVSSFGQGHLDAINPNTGRIHTVFKQLGAASGRLSCGSNQPNNDLAKLKGIAPKNCKYPNIQQLPADEATRSAFVAPNGYNFVSADFSAEESRLGADIYQDKEFLKEFTEGSGDTHSMFAWMVFRKECEACGCKSVADVKKLAPQWRKKVKGVEFAYMFGAAAPTISTSANCTVEEAQGYIDTLDKAFIGMSTFAKKGAQFVRSHGYILINPTTGHKMYWWDWDVWKERQKSYTQEFWEEYRQYHKGTGDTVALEVRQHFQAAGKYDRLARNSVTQGTGAIIMKTAMTWLFKWIVENNYFGIIHICASVHDEICCDYPKEVESFPKILEDTMENAAKKYCKSLSIPAEASISTHWVH